MKSNGLRFQVFACWISLVFGVLTLSRVSAQSPSPEAPGAATPTVAVPSPAAPPEGSPAPTASPVERGRVLYPVNAPQGSPVVAHGGETGTMPGLGTSFVMLLVLCAGGFYLVRRQSGFAPVGKGQRKLVVSESRSLGNRQFLVVVEYENERVLLGVTPGKIDYLCPLATPNAPAAAAFKGQVT